MIYDSIFKNSILLMILLLPFIVQAKTLSEKFSGYILLQVEQNGEAWYMNPADEKGYFLGHPDDAFEIMRKFGIGITNQDLLKIEIGDFSTLKNEDADGDGYFDIEELKNGYNPYGEGKVVLDQGFVSKNIGKIFLQVEKNGEAWYINPQDSKRYFLGRPSDAFGIMRDLGLGISDQDFQQLTIESVNKEVNIIPVNTPASPVALNTIDLVAQAFRSRDKSTAVKYFIPEMEKAIEYTVDSLSNEGLLTLGNLLSGSSLTESTEDRKTYSNTVYYNGESIPIHFYLKKVDGVWLMINL